MPNDPLPTASPAAPAPLPYAIRPPHGAASGNGHAAGPFTHSSHGGAFDSSHETRVAMAAGFHQIPNPFTLHALTAPKEGNTPEQYEDAHAQTWDGRRLTIAIADGASAAIYAREWARLLVATFAQEPPLFDARDRIAQLAEIWRQEAESGGSDATLPWYALEKLPTGSAATMTVVQVDTRTNQWKSWSVGDACLFVVRNNRLTYAVPKKRSRDFNDRPMLIGTNRQSAGSDRLEWTESTAPLDLEQDTLFLMTDAVAEWFFQSFEGGLAPWAELPDDEAAFPTWLKARRDAAQMKNDDVTILRVRHNRIAL